MKDKQLNPIQKTIVGAQFLFVAFGATVLVPLLVGLDPSVALFTAGVGTLIFHLVSMASPEHSRVWLLWVLSMV